MSVDPGWQGRFFEDFEVGDVYQHPLGRTLSEADNTWFTLLTMNTNQMHFNTEYAARSEFGRPLVVSTLTVAIAVGQSVTDLTQNAFANLGWDEIRMTHPVFAGDTLFSESIVLEKRESSSRPHAGIVAVQTRTLNQTAPRCARSSAPSTSTSGAPSRSRTPSRPPPRPLSLESVGMRITYGPWGETLAELADAARAAEDAGAEVVWLPELHRSATVAAAAAVAATRTVGVGTAVALAFTRSPMVTALEALDLDDLSGGRFVLGLGTGVQRLNEDWHHVDWGRPALHLRETVRNIRAFWAGCTTGAPIELDGERAPMRIRGYQRPYPVLRTDIPVYLAAMGPVLTRLAGEIGDGWISHELTSPAFLADRVLPELAAGLERGGRPRDEVDVVTSPVLLGRRRPGGGPTPERGHGRVLRLGPHLRRLLRLPRAGRGAGRPSSRPSAPGAARPGSPTRCPTTWSTAFTASGGRDDVAAALDRLRGPGRHHQAHPAHARARAGGGPGRPEGADRPDRRADRSRPMNDAHRAPLADVRIVAVEQYGAGPFGSVHLADLGAEVIKIEDPRVGGDVGRYVPPYAEGEDSLFFEAFNRNKRSLSLDLSRPRPAGGSSRTWCAPATRSTATCAATCRPRSASATTTSSTSTPRSCAAR